MGHVYIIMLRRCNLLERQKTPHWFFEPALHSAEFCWLYLELTLRPCQRLTSLSRK